MNWNIKHCFHWIIFTFTLLVCHILPSIHSQKCSFSFFSLYVCCYRLGVVVGLANEEMWRKKNCFCVVCYHIHTFIILMLVIWCSCCFVVLSFVFERYARILNWGCCWENLFLLLHHCAYAHKTNSQFMSEKRKKKILSCLRRDLMSFCLWTMTSMKAVEILFFFFFNFNEWFWIWFLYI